MNNVRPSNHWVRHTADPQLAELLRVEHDEIERRFGQVVRDARRGDWNRCRAEWSAFVDLLRRHMRFEDSQLSLPLDGGGVHAQVLGHELRRQHADLRLQISSLSIRIALGKLAAGEVEELREALRAHAVHEDECFHPWLEKLSE